MTICVNWPCTASAVRGYFNAVLSGGVGDDILALLSCTPGVVHVATAAFYKGINIDVVTYADYLYFYHVDLRTCIYPIYIIV